jgi:hypothetical protein
VSSRVSIVFWASTAATVLLLGSVWTLAGRIGASDAGPQDYILIAVAGLGFLATAFVSARIIFVVGRLKKRTRREAMGGAARSGR